MRARRGPTHRACLNRSRHTRPGRLPNHLPIVAALGAKHARGRPPHICAAARPHSTSCQSRAHLHAEESPHPMTWLAAYDVCMPAVHKQSVMPTSRAVGLLHGRCLTTHIVGFHGITGVAASWDHRSLWGGRNPLDRLQYIRAVLRPIRGRSGVNLGSVWRRSRVWGRSVVHMVSVRGDLGSIRGRSVFDVGSIEGHFGVK